MWYIGSKDFSTTISKDDIQNFIQKHPGERWALVENIQNMKEDTVKRLLQWFSHNEIKYINPQLVKGIEKEYFDLLKNEDQNMQIRPDVDYVRSSKDIEQMFKKHEFGPKYIGNFQQIVDKNILEISRDKLLYRRKELLSLSTKITNEEKQDLQNITAMLWLLSQQNIENTKSRTIYFDTERFDSTTNAFSVQCFFEQDIQGNKNYFSLNDLLNDLETFGVESGYPVLDISSLWWQHIVFTWAQKHIKLALIKNILAKYRDYQEVVMYDFKDYEKHITEKDYQNRNGVLAEKIVEWTFRHFANLNNDYHIQVKKASIWQDQKNKIDLIIQIQDKKSGVNIQKELQLTVNNDKSVLSNKRIQILRQKNIRNADLDLVELELHLLWQKMTVWRNMERPVWGIYRLLSFEDKDLLRKTYTRIIDELQSKMETK